MIHLMITYTLKPDAERELLPALAEYLDSIRANEPETLTYDVYQRSDDPLAYVHLMTFTDEGAEQHHQTSIALQRFTELLYPHCSSEPVFTSVELVHSKTLPVEE